MGIVKGLERQRAAAVRAVGRDPLAELRRARLFGRDGPVDVASPYLVLVDRDDRTVSRGLADALGLLVRHCDRTTHLQARPDDPLERMIFDALEQLRCQALAPELPGMRANLAAVAEAWCRNARAEGVGESGVGLLVYTLIHMVRARLGLGMTNEEVDSIIEGQRARLARLIGHALAELSATRSDQLAYAEPAREIARLVAEMAGDAAVTPGGASDSRYRMLVPPEWFDQTDEAVDATGIATGALVSGAGVDAELDGLGGYLVWTREFDVEPSGSELYPDQVRRRARAELDGLVREQAVSAHRIAQRLRRLFGSAQTDEWRFGVDEGLIDGSRLGQLVASPDAFEVFRRPRIVVRANTVVSILMDNSGSMKAQRYETLATLADTLSRALDLAGVSNEVLGHTTAAWTGGRPMAEWRAADKPVEPGRLTELSHIVYKDADTSYKRARHSLASMMLTRHFRESVDGEAIVWAHRRLMARPEPRKVLLVVSDGAPAEAATNMANGPDLLADHLEHVVDHIERRSPVEIAALTVDGDVSSVFRRSVPIDLDATLTIGAYGVLEVLF